MKKTLLRFIMIIPLVILFCFTFGCQQPSEEAAKESESAVDDYADIVAINKIWTQYAIGCNVGDFDLWISLWADDGIRMAPDAPAVIGKEQIREAMKPVFDQMTLYVTIGIKEVRVAGDWAFSRGTGTLSMTPKAGGKTIKLDGKYLTILERQADGSWKIAIDCFNSNVPPTESPPEKE